MTFQTPFTRHINILQLCSRKWDTLCICNDFALGYTMVKHSLHFPIRSWFGWHYQFSNTTFIIWCTQSDMLELDDFFERVLLFGIAIRCTITRFIYCNPGIEFDCLMWFTGAVMWTFAQLFLQTNHTGQWINEFMIMLTNRFGWIIISWGLLCINTLV